MPGIYGLIFEDESALPSGAQMIMSAPLERLPFHQARAARTPHALAGCVGLPGEDLLAQSDGVLLACDGEIVNLDGLRSNLAAGGDEAPPGEGQAALLLRAFQRLGADALCGLNGLYTVAVWEEPSRRLTLINDRLGIQKLYTWQGAGLFAFASEYKCINVLPGFSRHVDLAGVSDLIALGYLLDERTLFEGVSTLPAAARATYERGRLSVRRYWDYAFGANGGRPAGEYENGLAGHLEEAVRLRLRPDTALLLTGGVDSRAIAGYATRLCGHQCLVANTIGSERSDDVLHGREIARALGLDFTLLPIGESYIADYAAEAVWKTEANMNVFAAWIFAEERFLGERGLRHAMTGIGGEGVSGRHLWFKWLESDLDKALGMIYRKERFSSLQKLMKPSAYAAARDASWDSVRRAVLQAPADDPLDKIDYAMHTQKMRRHATSTQVLADYARALDPFWDSELVDYATRIPATMRARGYLFKRLLRHQFPQLAQMGKPVGRVQLSPAGELRLRPLSRLYEAARLRLMRRKRKSMGFQGDNPSGYIQPNAALRGESRQFVLQRLGRSELLDDIFDIDAVRALVDDHMAGRRHEHVLVCALLTFALWRQQFCE